MAASDKFDRESGPPTGIRRSDCTDSFSSDPGAEKPTLGPGNTIPPSPEEDHAPSLGETAPARGLSMSVIGALVCWVFFGLL